MFAEKEMKKLFKSTYNTSSFMMILPRRKYPPSESDAAKVITKIK